MSRSYLRDNLDPNIKFVDYTLQDGKTCRPISTVNVNDLSINIDFLNTPDPGYIYIDVTDHIENPNNGTLQGEVNGAWDNWEWVTKTGTGLPINTQTDASPVMISYTNVTGSWIRIRFVSGVGGDVTINSATFQGKANTHNGGV